MLYCLHCCHLRQCLLQISVVLGAPVSRVVTQMCTLPVSNLWSKINTPTSRNKAEKLLCFSLSNSMFVYLDLARYYCTLCGVCTALFSLYCVCISVSLVNKSMFYNHFQWCSLHFTSRVYYQACIYYILI